MEIMATELISMVRLGGFSQIWWIIMELSMRPGMSLVPASCKFEQRSITGVPPGVS